MNWTRVGLKTGAKETLSSNYWIFVLAALLMLIVGDEVLSFDFNVDGFDGAGISIEGVDIFGQGDQINDVVKDIPSAYIDDAAALFQGGVSQFLWGTLFAGVAIVAVCASLLFKIFVSGPVEMGIDHTFLKGQYEKAQAKDVLFGFSNGAYMNVVLVQFLRALFTSLWTLLFVIPGIIKSYEYRMIPYLLAENPQMDRRTAFETSKRMMMGQKWDTFVLDLSFIPWNLLSAITFHIVGIFYVDPYINSTNARLYMALKDAPAQADAEVKDAEL